MRHWHREMWQKGWQRVGLRRAVRTSCLDDFPTGLEALLQPPQRRRCELASRCCYQLCRFLRQTVPDGIQGRHERALARSIGRQTSMRVPPSRLGGQTAWLCRPPPSCCVPSSHLRTLPLATVCVRFLLGMTVSPRSYPIVGKELQFIPTLFRPSVQGGRAVDLARG